MRRLLPALLLLLFCAPSLAQPALRYHHIRDLRATAQSTPDMTVAVASGRAYIANSLVTYAGGNSPSFTAPGADNRIDLLTMNASGTLAITQGAAAASPSAPAIPDDLLPICYVYLKNTSTSIRAYDTSTATHGYIQFDVRPFINAIPQDIRTTGTPQFAGIGVGTAATGSVDITLGANQAIKTQMERTGYETWDFRLSDPGDGKGLGLYNQDDAAYRAFFKETGAVGINTTNPAHDFHVIGISNIQGRNVSRTDSNYLLSIGSNKATVYDREMNADQGTLAVKGSLQLSGDVTSHYGITIKAFAIADSGARTLTRQIGIYPEGSFTGTSDGGSMTILDTYGILVGPHWDTATRTAYGIYIDDSNPTSADDLYHLFIEAPTGASGDNIGIYNRGSLFQELAATFTSTVDVIHTATEADDHTVEIETDAAGFGDVKALEIDYVTGAISAGEDEGVVLINIDETLATGGDVFAVEVLATDGSADVYGLKVGALIGPVHQDSGVFVNPTTGTDNTPSTDVPAMIDGSTGTTTAIFEADNEYIIIGAATPFEEIEFILTTPASVSIKPTFWYSTAGTGQFTQFTPVDGTNGFNHTGVVAWDASDLTGHVADDVTTTFDIRVIRTRNNLGTSPVLGYAKVAATTEYIWDKDGDINLANIAASGTLDVDGVTTITGLATGGYTDYDLLVGDTTTPDYGMIQMGNAAIGRTSYTAGNIDLDGTVLFRNIGGPVTSPVEFIFVESAGNTCRFALAESAVGNATYNSRSMLLAGPAPADTDFVKVSYWQTTNSIFGNLACDTVGSGADLGVQNDVEIEGDLFVDDIKESTSAAGITLNHHTYLANTFDLIPATDEGSDLGDATHAFGQLYVEQIGPVGDADLLGLSSGVLTVNGQILFTGQATILNIDRGGAHDQWQLLKSATGVDHLLFYNVDDAVSTLKLFDTGGAEVIGDFTVVGDGIIKTQGAAGSEQTALTLGNIDFTAGMLTNLLWVTDIDGGSERDAAVIKVEQDDANSAILSIWVDEAGLQQVLTLTGTGDLTVTGTAISFANMKSGTTQGGAGAAAGELWADTDDANTVKLGT